MMFRNWIALTVGLVLVLGLGAAALPALVAESDEPRDVLLIARDMAFYLGPNGTVPNPVIKVAPGEQIRITLLNVGGGFEHDLAVEAWHLATPRLRGEDEASLVFRAPQKAGRVDYVCTQHATMMRGTIEVTSSGSEGS